MLGSTTSISSSLVEFCQLFPLSSDDSLELRNLLVLACERQHHVVSFDKLPEICNLFVLGCECLIQASLELRGGDCVELSLQGRGLCASGCESS